MAIDFHAHIITPEYRAGLKILGIDPLAADGFALPEWSEQAHLEFMREAGIEKSILSSPTPHLLGDDERLTAKIHRKVNASIAEVCGKYPDKFSFVASVPLPYTDEAIEEYRFAKEKLGAVGVKLTTHAGGEPVALDMLLSVAGEEKIVYGSDFPHSPAKVVLAKKKHLEESPHYERLLRKIYGENEKNCLGK